MDAPWGVCVESASTGIGRHRWRARSIYGRQTRRWALKLSWFVGVDWGSQKHQAWVIDADGERVGERAFEHGGQGLSAMAAWLLSVSAGEAAAVGVAIEVPRGPVVESLMERGFVVHSINPKQLDLVPGSRLAIGGEGRPAGRAGTRLGAT